MNASRLCLAVVAAVLVASIGRAPVLYSAQPAAAAIEELIAEKDRAAPADDKEDTVSLDGRAAAWRTRDGQKWAVMRNGVRQGTTFDEVRSLTFSQDGTHLAFAARRDKSEGPPFDIIGGIDFSADSRRFSYAAADIRRGFGKQKAVGRTVVDGVAGPEFEGDQVGSLLNTVSLIGGYFNEGAVRPAVLRRDAAARRHHSARKLKPES